MIDYSRHPRPESIQYFEARMRDHDKVLECRLIEEYYYKITRRGMSSIKVLVTNYYTIGYGELVDLIGEHPDMNCVITISNWNGYTNKAYEEGKRRGIGVFKMKEFMGALNYEQPHKYLRPVDREHYR